MVSWSSHLMGKMFCVASYMGQILGLSFSKKVRTVLRECLNWKEVAAQMISPSFPLRLHFLEGPGDRFGPNL